MVNQKPVNIYSILSTPSEKEQEPGEKNKAPGVRQARSSTNGSTAPNSMPLFVYGWLPLGSCGKSGRTPAWQQVSTRLPEDGIPEGTGSCDPSQLFPRVAYIWSCRETRQQTLPKLALPKHRMEVQRQHRWVPWWTEDHRWLPVHRYWVLPGFLFPPPKKQLIKMLSYLLSKDDYLFQIYSKFIPT